MVTFNGRDRLIEITDSSVFSLDVEKEIYSEWKRWSQLGSNAKFAPAFTLSSVFGGNPTVSSQSAPKYFFLTNYWRVFINNGNVVSIGLNLYSEDFESPYLVAPGSGVSDRNSDAVNVNSEDIQTQSFTNNRVYIQDSTSIVGVDHPKGTPRRRVNNISDALIIAAVRGLNEYDIKGSFTITEDVSNSRIWGNTDRFTSLTFDTSSITNNLIIEECYLDGDLNGVLTIQNSRLGSILDFDGSLKSCVIEGPIVLNSGSTNDVFLEDCRSAIAGLGRPVVDVNGANINLSIRNYTGGITISGVDKGNNISVDCISGTVEFDSTCTNGTARVGGTVELIDNSGPGFIINQERSVKTLASGGSLTPQQANQLSELWQIAGLDINNPLVITDILKQSGATELDVICNPDGSVTVQRK